MRQMETIALCVFFLVCSCSFTQGEHESNSPTRFGNLPKPSTTSPSQRSSTSKPKSRLRPPLVSTSPEEDNRAATDLSANDTLSQSSNDTVNSTVTPGLPTGAAEPKVNTFAPVNTTSVLGNLDGQDGVNPLTGDNQTNSTASNTTLSTNTTTLLPKYEPKTTTLTSFVSLETLSASTRPQVTSSPLATTSQSKGKSPAVATKGTSAPTTTTTTTTTTKATQTTEFISTPVLAKARVDTPSELNVGDDTEYSRTSVDPLLAGLVSVFVVTAAIVSLLIFLKFRHRNERPEFRRLQELPMDDMMEDTPLSMYSY